jgi:UDP:flavonoid glycosyltransferase YjiC (YdhE family)
MQVLITTIPVTGHFHPLVPVGRALQQAGDEVTFACAEQYRETIEANGFPYIPAGLYRPWPEVDAEVQREIPDTSDPRYLYRLFERLFVDPTSRRMAADLVRLFDDWRPDLVVRDLNELGGCIAAEVAGIPHATAGANGYRSIAERRASYGPTLDAIRREHGLPADPELAMLYRYLDFIYIPQEFLLPTDFVAPTAHFVNMPPFDQSGHETLPGWVTELPNMPTVYVTLGTSFNRTPGVLETIVAALRDEPLNLIVTVGRNRDPAELGPQPENVRIERYVPQTLLYPIVDLVVTQGGANTTHAALRHGIPLVMVPIGADQFENAARSTAYGVARVIAPEERTPDTIRAAVHDVLESPRYRERARQFQTALDALPGAEHAVELLDRLARDRKPLMRWR